jgi:signal transduction histidine kinase
VALADGVAGIQRQIVAVSDSVFHLADAGHRVEAYRLAQRELKGRLQPALTQMNREIYRRARESSVKGAYSRLEEILAAEGRTLVAIIALSLAAGLAASWPISRSLARPVANLTRAMAVVGGGDLDHPIQATSRDEIGDLARALERMTAKLRESRQQLVQAEKLASIGEMSAAVAHGLRNPLASLRAAAQLVRRHPDSPSATEHLDAIIEEVDRLDRRISHLLSFSRPAPFHPVSESVPRLIEEPCPRRPAHPRAACGPRNGGPGDTSAGEVDPMQVEQAILEIVSNALDAAEAKAPDWRLRVRRRGARRCRGGSDGHRRRHPRSSCRPCASRSSRHDRRGPVWASAIAKRYVEMNGGRLEIASRAGVGTTVRVRLPIGAAA